MIEEKIGVIGHEIVLASRRLIVAQSDRSAAILLPAGNGVIIGDLFCRRTNKHIDAISSENGASIAESPGIDLVERFWGDYVALIEQDGIHVIRDPLGGLQCLHSIWGDLRLIYSDIVLPHRLGLTTGRVDWSLTAQILVQPASRPRQTCIEGVDEVVAGTQLTFSASDATATELWSPWRFANPGIQIATREEAVEVLRQSVLDVVGAWASVTSRPLLELSGGLDSSIVAVALGGADSEITCALMRAADPASDETRYAHAVSDAINAARIDIDLDPSALDFNGVSLIPRPTDHPLKMIVDQALARAGVEQATNGYFSGSGGDYVFNYLQSSAPAADALKAFGLGQVFLRAVDDVAGLYRTNAWRVGLLALRKAVGPTRRRKHQLNPFLSTALSDTICEPHPWLSAPPGAWPGKLEQISAVAAGLGVREGLTRASIAPLRMPLLAQPLVEAALRIPSWMAVDGGRNRAVARDAFSTDLPRLILERRTKGHFKRLNGDMLRCHAARIRSLLLDGELASRGLLNTGRIEQYMSSSQVDDDSTHILRLACAELWIDAWKAKQADRPQTISVARRF